MGRLGTVILATTAYVQANAVTADVIDAVKAAIATGKGYPLKMNPTSFGGGATEFNLTMPGDVPFIAGHKYSVSGVFFVRIAGGATILGTRVIRDAVVRNDFSGVVFNERAGDTIVGDKHGMFATFFATEDDFPSLGAAIGPPCLTAVFKVQPGQDVQVEFDGTMADLGEDT